jgi:hypothetical protein
MDPDTWFSMSVNALISTTIAKTVSEEEGLF